MIGSRTGITRVPLDCLGPWHQLHWDGHEKVGSQALDMGGVGLPVYAGKDHFSSFVPIMRVLPNVRWAIPLDTFSWTWWRTTDACFTPYLPVDLTSNHFSRYSTSNYDGQGIRNLGNGQNTWRTTVATIITTAVIWDFQWVSSLCLDRLEVAPEYTLEEWPAAVQVQSKHNTPIEGFWRWKCQGEGHSIREAIFIGKSEGLYNPNNELHQCVFGQGLHLY
jgi:hypothetical protein